MRARSAYGQIPTETVQRFLVELWDTRRYNWHFYVVIQIMERFDRISLLLIVKRLQIHNTYKPTIYNATT